MASEKENYNGSSPPETAPVVPEAERTVEFNIEASSDFARVDGKFASNKERRRSVASSSERASSSNRSSLELRRAPVDALLRPRANSGADTDVSSRSEAEVEDQDDTIDLMHRTCLRPGYTLSKQLMLSFGIINTLAIFVVVVICVVVAISTGDDVKSINIGAFEALLKDRQGSTARYLAESVDQRLMLFDTVKMMVEATQDRFEGYPEPSDDYVPFLDVYTQTRKYPISAEPMPLEWELEANVNDENYNEFFLSETRWDFYRRRPANTVKAGFLMQGSCDPSVLDPNHDAYWPNCTDANNNITSGGVVAPSSTNGFIYQKASDLVPLLRTLFETKEEIRDLGLYFINSGAGASVTFPQYTVPYNGSYNSSGCDWMNEPNPLDPTRSIGTQDMINRCHPAGETVSTRGYNPMEREWCAYMAMNPEVFVATVGKDSWNSNQYLLTLGKGIYDRTTKDFIACSYIGIQVSSFEKELRRYKITPHSEVSIIVWGESGIIAASTMFNGTERDLAIPVYEAHLGLTKDSYSSLYDLVDYKSQWAPEEVRKLYTNFIIDSGDYFVASYPMPPVPKEYDPDYRPIFLVITSTAKDDVDDVVEESNEIIDDSIQRVNVLAIVIGCVGLAVSMVIIAVMAHVITSPLRSMNATASEIVNQFGDASAEQVISSSNGLLTEYPFAPKTELSEVVEEFNKMVVSFSGKAIAKSEKGKQEEVENIFNIRKPFLDLYESRRSDGFAYNVEAQSHQSIDTIDLLDELSYRNEGSNLLVESIKQKKLSDIDSSPKVKTRSPLFLWIALLIIVPLLVGSVLVAAILFSFYQGRFEDFVTRAEGHFLEVEASILSVNSKLRADYVAGLTSKSIAELHIHTRYASWLLFGGLNQSDSFTEVLEGDEDCKTYSADFDRCPFIQENYVCDCDWNQNVYSTPCQNYNNETSSRYLQKRYMLVQSNGDPLDGSRKVTDFPNVSFSPETTVWFDNQTVVAGFEAGASAAGYNTTFDRLRQASAIPIMEALFNYDKETRSLLTVLIGFEADGMTVAYTGCDISWATLSAWSSTEDNGASSFRPELCPIGKYGYDPRYVDLLFAYCLLHTTCWKSDHSSVMFRRCREWYDTGRNLYLQNRTSLYVTAPYLFAARNLNAQSATTPLFDPKTGQHVGQALVDFETKPIYEALQDETQFVEGGFPLLIAAGSEIGDTVIAPDFSTTTEEAVPVAEKVLRYDARCTEPDCVDNAKRFNGIVNAMKNGETIEREDAPVEFLRKTRSGGSEEMIIAYSPVNVKMYRMVDSSDFSRGVTVSDFLIYSLAFVQSKASILQPYKEIENEMYKSLSLAVVILSVVVAGAVLLVLYLSHRLALSISKPMVYLLHLIRSINR
eukprot:scaffold6265_cov193-Cylindrotheca_fusiformis.AAC.20